MDKTIEKTVNFSKKEKRLMDLSDDPVLKKMLEQERIESEEVDMSLLLKLMAYLKRHRGLSLACVLLSVVESVLMALPPYVVGLAIDAVRRDTARQLSLIHI